METNKFANNLERWGSVLEDWPEGARAEASELLTRSEAARRMLQQAELLDEALRQASHANNAEAHKAPPGLQQRIVEQVRRPPPRDAWQRLADWFGAALWRPAMMATVVLVCSVVVGMNSTAIDSETDSLAQTMGETDAVLHELSLFAFTETYQEIEDAQ